MSRSVLNGMALALICLLTSPATAATSHLGHHAVHHGEWRINPRLCPDLVEDRRDRRVTYSRADRREDRRDAAVVNCPARAWVWVGPHPFNPRIHPVRPVVTAIHIRNGGYFYRPRANAAYVRINLVIR